MTLLNCIWAISTYHLVPSADSILIQFILLAVPLLFSLAVGLGYIAVEPFARRSWPKLMVSWQRLLNGRLRDPLVGRDVLMGMLAGAVITAIMLGVNAVVGISEAFPVRPGFGLGSWAALGASLWRPSEACLDAMTWLALLTIATGILRKKWLALVVTGFIMVAQYASFNVVDLALTVLFVSIFMTILLRFGLIAIICFDVVFLTIGTSPPLNFSQWYSGRAMIALVIPLSFVVYGFWVSLGGQPILGRALTEE